MTIPEESGIRLNRFLAEAGVCSRRDADQLVFAGQVTINGQPAQSPAQRLDPAKDAVKVNGKRVHAQPLVYVLLHKPEGVVSTLQDPQRRPTVMDLLRGVHSRVFPVGRLDYNTSGVLLLTNDGDLALRLTHPRYGFSKTYVARVQGEPKPSDIRRLETGVRVPGWSGRYEKTLPAKARLLKYFRTGALIELTLQEGRQHQVRNMCRAVGHPVEKLTRVKFGFLTAAGLHPGQWRYLTPEEIKRLKNAAENGRG